MSNSRTINVDAINRTVFLNSITNKNSSTRHEKPSFRLLVKEVQVNPKIMQAILVALGFLPEADSKSQSLKILLGSDSS